MFRKELTDKDKRIYFCASMKAFTDVEKTITEDFSKSLYELMKIL